MLSYAVYILVLVSMSSTTGGVEASTPANKNGVESQTSIDEDSLLQIHTNQAANKMMRRLDQVNDQRKKKDVELLLYQYYQWCKRKEKVFVDMNDKHSTLKSAARLANIEHYLPGIVSIAIPGEMDGFQELAHFGVERDGSLSRPVYQGWSDETFQTMTTLYALKDIKAPTDYDSTIAFTAELTLPKADEVQECENW